MKKFKAMFASLSMVLALTCFVHPIQVRAQNTSDSKPKGGNTGTGDAEAAARALLAWLIGLVS